MSAIIPFPAAFGPSASLHDQIIGSLPDQKPRWLVEGSLFDHRWMVTTDDPAKKRNAVQLLVHDVVVEPGGGRLSAPEREHDLITSKLLAYTQLQPPSRASATLAVTRVRLLHWLIRWRNAEGFYRMADLDSEDLFRRWAECMRFGLAGVIDWPARVSGFIASVEDGHLEIPTRLENDSVPVVNHEAVAAHLGVTSFKGAPEAEYLRLLEFVASKGMLQKQLAETYAVLKAKGAGAGAPITQQTLASHFSIWDCLWRMRDLAVHDPLKYNPFAGRGPFLRAGEFTKDSGGRTRTAPEGQVCFLVDRALRWVFDYAPQLLAAVEQIAAVERAEGRPTPKQRAAVRTILHALEFDGPGAPNLYRDAMFLNRIARNQEWRDSGAISFHSAAFDLLPTACAVVIATFTARRKEEIASLQDDCIEYDADNEPWMLTYIEKTLRDIDRIPIPVSVVKAVDVLLKLSAYARQQSSERWLFQFLIPFVGNRRDYLFGQAIKRFAAFVEVPPMADGTAWEFSPHQFRRFFSIVYYHRFRYASLTALSAFLKHYDPDMTRRYVTEVTKGNLSRVREAATMTAAKVQEMKAAGNADGVATARKQLVEMRAADLAMRARQRDFEEGRLDAEFARLWAVANGEEPMGGHRGETLKAELETMIREARRQIELAPTGSASEDDAFNGLLRGFVKAHVFEPHPQGHSYCGCGRSSDELAAAACLLQKALVKGEAVVSLALGPDYGYADARTCSGCPHNIQMQENRLWWERRLRSSLGQAQTAVTEHFSGVARSDAEMCHDHIRRCFDEARPMTATIGQEGMRND